MNGAGQPDYKPIGGSSPFARPANGDFKSLYNGNIAGMTVHNAGLLKGDPNAVPLFNNYRYDQLNRLVGMQVYKGLNIANNEWSDIEPLKDYRESISYDPNGNILTYDRNGSPSIPGKEEKMDELTYIYYANKNQLRQVTDNPAFSGYYTEDIDNQANPDNYTYDAIGNLKTDYAEGIDNIEWTVYGKIAGIIKDEDMNPATTTDKTSILYTYDASGNRIRKTVTPSSGNAVTTVYVRDASGNVMSIYEKISGQTLKQTEVHIYGSSRLGMATEKSVASQITLDGDFGAAKATVFARGNKFFELSNHLGNVLAMVSDRKIGIDADANGTVDNYIADVVSAQDYYPFGSLMPGRNWNGGKYRYGFNGKENDSDVKGEGNQQDYGFRIYDSRIGKFLSVDPLSKEYPWNSTYAFAENDVIRSIDLDGLEKYIIHQRSFAPWKYFGEASNFGMYKYSGDDRGFSIASDETIKTKVSTAITVDLSSSKAELTMARQFGQTIRYDGNTGRELKRAPIVDPEVSLYNAQKEGSKTTIKARMEGKAPLAPFPILDGISSLIDQPIVWMGTTTIDNHIAEGYISVQYTYVGKGFPALESFIEDEKGTKIFIGAYVSPGKDNILQALSGPEFAVDGTMQIKIATDNDGNFFGVYWKDFKGNDIIMNPKNYNEQFTSTPAAKDLPEE